MCMIYLILLSDLIRIELPVRNYVTIFLNNVCNLFFLIIQNCVLKDIR